MTKLDLLEDAIRGADLTRPERIDILTFLARQEGAKWNDLRASIAQLREEGILDRKAQPAQHTRRAQEHLQNLLRCR